MRSHWAISPSVAVAARSVAVVTPTCIIVTALPAVFFSRDTPLAKVPSVDLEKLMAEDSDADMKVGVRTALDLNWKEGFDAFTCTECGRCTAACRYRALEPAHIRRRRPGLTCSLCGDCLAFCPESALSYRFFGLSPEAARRLFLVLAVSLHAVFLGVARI